MKNSLPVILIILLQLLSGAPVKAHVSVRDSVLIIPEGTKRIQAQAFADREDFNAISFPKSLTEIGEYAFLGCRKLREAELPASVTLLGEGAFRECARLEKVSLPAVMKVPKQAFAWCPSLKDVRLSLRCNDIGSHAFAYCTALEYIRIPLFMMHIGSNAFSFCSSLREIELPATVVELESYAFSECGNLREATLPGNGRMLGELIFSGCTRLKKIRIDSSIPPTFDCNSDLFEPSQAYLYDRCMLEVPGDAIGDYRGSPACWSRFRHIRAL